MITKQKTMINENAVGGGGTQQKKKTSLLDQPFSSEPD